jgi:hypothetical protein
MIYWLLAMVLACAVAFWLRQYHVKTEQASHVADSNKYHCVAITNTKNPCKAVKRLEGKRFLSTKAPIFPLTGCAADDCQCHYIHYDDRRDEERRYLYGRYGSTPPATIDHDRRNIPGRRNDDVMDLDENKIPGLF